MSEQRQKSNSETNISSINDDFQEITDDEIRRSQKEQQAITQSRRIYHTYEDIIKSSIKLDKPDNIILTSIWSAFRTRLSNLKNSIKFNLITINTYVDFKSLNYLRLFDQVFSDKDIKDGVVDRYLYNVFQFTYRSDFTPIEHHGKIYTTDCGWGCMIRVAQMMMAKGVFEKKLYDIKQLGIDINLDLLTSCKVDTLLLFFDNDLSISDISGNKDFSCYATNIKNIINDEEKSLRESKPDKYDGESIVQNDMFHQDITNIYVSEVTPPFSIQNICKMGLFYDKGPGLWFSEVIMSNIFAELNYQFQVLDMEFFNYSDGVIYETEILERCFEAVNCECDNVENIPINDFINNLWEDSICNKCLSLYNKDQLYKFKDKYYKLKKGGFIFISVRLGLDSIAPEYNSPILNIFKIPYNLGIIGGKHNSAHYFIGESANKLIYLDPHINQQASKDRESLENRDLDSYKPVYFYKTEIHSISPAFTTAFYFRDIGEYKKLVEGFSIHNSFNYPVFKFRSENSSKIIQQTVKDIVIDDDFCIINYES
jgi:hypothetical protein